MHSEYTDEIENSSYTRRAFSMGRKSKYSAEEKLLILNEVLRNGIHKVITKYKISQKNYQAVESSIQVSGNARTSNKSS